jgi:hypothetical protein
LFQWPVIFARDARIYMGEPKRRAGLPRLAIVVLRSWTPVVQAIPAAGERGMVTPRYVIAPARSERRAGLPRPAWRSPPDPG